MIKNHLYNGKITSNSYKGQQFDLNDSLYNYDFVSFECYGNSYVESNSSFHFSYKIIPVALFGDITKIHDGILVRPSSKSITIQSIVIPPGRILVLSDIYGYKMP